MTDKLSKAEKRKRKKEEKQKKKVVIIPEKIVFKTIKIAPIPNLSKTLRIHETPSQSKSVYIPNELNFNLSCVLTWSDCHSDLEGNWSWGESRMWSDAEWENEIKKRFDSLTNSTWQEIIHEHKTPAKGGKSVPRNHPQDIDTLVKEAQDRWIQIGLEDFPVAFRFRFANTIRAWGIKMDGHFYLIWWERHHKIYPV
jgi:hypothetical protein